ncbi:MAG: sugar transferase, partial [Lachnospiraceae bacterium]
SGIILSDEKSQRDAIEGTSVVAIGREEALYYLQKNWVDEVLIHLPEDEEASKEVIAMCTKMGITVHLTLTRVLNAERQVIEKLGGYTVLSTSINMATTKQLFAKRALDIVGGVVGVFFTGIFFLFVAPLIFIQSPGPIFFGQERVGRNGKHFKLYKFRSMYLDAEARKAELLAQNEMGSELMFKIENDPRIIGGSRGIGNFIRKTSIDEFPQFFNVLKGNMSLVGTRPPTVDEWNQYEMHHRKRLSAKPGITGMWQVSGRSSITDFEEVVKLDTQYIENWSFGMDLKILAKTVEVVLGKDGAA